MTAVLNMGNSALPIDRCKLNLTPIPSTGMVTVHYAQPTMSQSVLHSLLYIISIPGPHYTDVMLFWFLDTESTIYRQGILSCRQCCTSIQLSVKPFGAWTPLLTPNLSCGVSIDTPLAAKFF